MKKILTAAIFATFAFPTASMALLSDEDVLANYENSIAARGAGRPDVAEGILRALIAERPGTVQLRFDLGVALAEQGRCAAASRAFDDGRQIRNTPSYNRTVQSVMDSLCPGLAPFEFSLGATIISDSNANGGAADRSIEIGGLPFELSDDAVAQSRSGYSITGELGYNIKIKDGNYIVPSVGFSLADYKGSDLDNLTVTPGIYYRRLGDRTDWRIGPTAVLGFNQDGISTVGYGLIARGAVALSPRTVAYLDVSYIDAEDRNNRLRDYEQRNLTATVSHLIDGTNMTVRATLAITDLAYADPLQDLTSRDFTIGLSGSIAQKTGYDLALTRRISTGSIPHPLFGDREDKVLIATARASFAQFEGWYGRPYLGVSHTISDSTWDLKTFDRTRFILGLTKSF